MNSIPSAPNSSPWILQGSDQSFAVDVIDASHQRPVIVDFSADWCQPCKQLLPSLENAVNHAQGAVGLVKINIDRHPKIATQLRVQSLPTVLVFYQGQPIDGFQGLLPASQVNQLVERLSKLAPQTDTLPSTDEQLLELAQQFLSHNNPSKALACYQQYLETNPEHVIAYAGTIHCHIALQQYQQALKWLDTCPASLKNAPELQAARSALELAEQAQQVRDLSTLKAALELNPQNHATRFELALAYYQMQLHQEAMTELLEIVRRDRSWQDDQARQQLLKMFEAIGLSDPRTVQARRTLSKLLFT